MNLGFSNALSLPNVVPADKPRFNAKDLVIQNSYRVASFTSGDGCFYVSIKKSDTTVSGYAVEIRLRITQHSRDIILMESLILYLGCGRVEEESKAYPPPSFIFIYYIKKVKRDKINWLCVQLFFFFIKKKKYHDLLRKK